MIRQRIRIRFSKTGDLRLISHRDLVRVWERLFRRAALRLSMSEGFHPKAKLNFPSALGLGIAGLDEVMEVEIDEPADVEQLRRRLEPLCPPGLEILEITAPAEGSRKPQVVSMTYEVTVPDDRRQAAAEAARHLMSLPQLLVKRANRDEPVDVRQELDTLEFEPGSGALKMKLMASRQASARPREVLEAVGLGDLEQLGRHLLRTRVELQA